MKANEMGSMWLRDRAQVLRTAATKAENAYTPTTPLGKVCTHVAAAYRNAATVLIGAAEELEANATPATASPRVGERET